MLFNKHQTQFYWVLSFMFTVLCQFSSLSRVWFLGYTNTWNTKAATSLVQSLTSPFGSCNDTVPTALQFHPRHTWPPLRFMRPPLDVPCSHGASVLATEGASGPWTRTWGQASSATSQPCTEDRTWRSSSFITSTPTQPRMDLSLLPPTPKNGCNCSLHTNAMLGR